MVCCGESASSSVFVVGDEWAVRFFAVILGWPKYPAKATYLQSMPAAFVSPSHRGLYVLNK